MDHDGEGRVVGQSWDTGGATYNAATGYAPTGETLWRTFPDGDTVGTALDPWTYDSLGRLAAAPGVVGAQNYEADVRTAEVGCPSGVSTSFLYSPSRRWIDSIETTGPSSLERKVRSAYRFPTAQSGHSLGGGDGGFPGLRAAARRSLPGARASGYVGKRSPLAGAGPRRPASRQGQANDRGGDRCRG